MKDAFIIFEENISDLGMRIHPETGNPDWKDFASRCGFLQLPIAHIKKSCKKFLDACDVASSTISQPLSSSGIRMDSSVFGGITAPVGTSSTISSNAARKVWHRLLFFYAIRKEVLRLKDSDIIARIQEKDHFVKLTNDADLLPATWWKSGYHDVAVLKHLESQGFHKIDSFIAEIAAEAVADSPKSAAGQQHATSLPTASAVEARLTWVVNLFQHHDGNLSNSKDKDGTVFESSADVREHKKRKRAE
jgi:hypothetical protein